MPGRHPERIREVLDRLVLIQKAAIDEAERARDRRPRAVPRRRPGRGFRSAPQAGAEARPLGGGGGGKEDDVSRLGGLHRTGGSAIDSGGQDTGEEGSIEARIPRDPCAIAFAPIEGSPIAHDGEETST